MAKPNAARIGSPVFDQRSRETSQRREPKRADASSAGNDPGSKHLMPGLLVDGQSFRAFVPARRRQEASPSDRSRHAAAQTASVGRAIEVATASASAGSCPVDPELPVRGGFFTVATRCRLELSTPIPNVERFAWCRRAAQLRALRHDVWRSSPVHAARDPHSLRLQGMRLRRAFDDVPTAWSAGALPRPSRTDPRPRTTTETGRLAARSNLQRAVGPRHPDLGKKIGGR